MSRQNNMQCRRNIIMDNVYVLYSIMKQKEADSDEIESIMSIEQIQDEERFFRVLCINTSNLISGKRIPGIFEFAELVSELELEIELFGSDNYFPVNTNANHAATDYIIGSMINSDNSLTTVEKALDGGYHVLTTFIDGTIAGVHFKSKKRAYRYLQQCFGKKCVETLFNEENKNSFYST